MKTKLRVLSPLLGAAALLLAGCSTIHSRINEKGSVFYSLDSSTQAKIEHGDVGLGFTADMVYMALGNPNVKRQHTTADGTSETWVYRTYYDQSYGGYVGYHRWGAWNHGFYRMYWEPVYRTMPSDDIRVTFRDGKVTAIDQARA